MLKNKEFSGVVSDKLISSLSEEIGVNVSVSNIKFSLRNSIVIEDFLIPDQNGDTLLFSKYLGIKIKALNINRKKISFSKLESDQLLLNIVETSPNKFNFDFIIDSLSRTDSKPFDWMLSFKKIDFSNHYYNINTIKKEYNFQNINIVAENFYFGETKKTISIAKCSGKLNNNSLVDNLSFKAIQDDEQFEFNNLEYVNKNSKVSVPKAYILVDSTGVKDFSVNLEKSVINLENFSFLSDYIANSTETIRLKGMLMGNKEYLNLVKLSVATLTNTKLLTNVSFYKTNNANNISYKAYLSHFTSNRSDILHILKRYADVDTSKINLDFFKTDKLEYTGSVKGTPTNHNINGVLLSALGKFITKSDIAIDTAKMTTKIKSRLNTRPLNLNVLTKNDDFGSCVLNVDADGVVSKNTFDFNVDAFVSNLEFRNYYYDSVSIEGRVTDNNFEGNVKSLDPKAKFDFSGLVDYGELFSCNFTLQAKSFDLKALGLDKKKESNLSFNLLADIKGENLKKSNGGVLISNLLLLRDSSYIATDSISILSSESGENRQIDIYSEFAEGNLFGNFNTFNLLADFKSIIYHYLPSLKKKEVENSGKNRFKFNVVANYPQPLLELFSTKLKIASGTKVSGEFNSLDSSLSVMLLSDYVAFNKKTIDGIDLNSYTENDKFYIKLNSDDFKYTEKNGFNNFFFNATIKNDSINLSKGWNNWLGARSSGEIKSLLSLTKSATSSNPFFKLDIYPSSINVLDTIWNINKGVVKKDSLGIMLKNIRISNGSSFLETEGVVSKNENDTLNVNLKNINAEQFNGLINNSLVKFNGFVSGEATIISVLKSPKVSSNIYIKSFALNKEPFGDLKLESDWDNELKIVNVNGYNKLKNKNTISFNGYISPLNKFLDINTNITEHNLTVISPYLKSSFSDIAGKVTGKARLFGDLNNLNWEGVVFASNAGLKVKATNVYYSFSDSVYFSKNKIIFSDILIHDEENNTGVLDGTISHERFKVFTVNFHAKTKRILGLDTKSSDNELFYGKVYGGGIVDISGETEDIEISVSAKSLENSVFTVSLEGEGEVEDNDFIKFVSFDSISMSKTKKIDSKFERKSKITFIADLDVTSESEVQIIFDQRIGDALKARGNAKINLVYENEDFFINGKYDITQGDFLFTLQNVISKRLKIQQGSYVSFPGDLMDAKISLDAIYRVRKALVYDLTQDETDKNKRVDVDCHLLMSGKLLNSGIDFSLTTPSVTNNDIVDRLNKLPNEDLNKQVLSLLLVNKFSPYRVTTSPAPGVTSGKLGATTASEILSNQLTGWLSQVSSGFDMGVTYRPGTEYSTQEYELALSKNLWNNRIILNGNVVYSEQDELITGINQSYRPYTTDVQVEFKLNKKGNVRFRAFQKVNNDIEYNTSPYKQGVGIFYTEEFDDFGELMQKMFRKSVAKKPKELKIEKR